MQIAALNLPEWVVGLALAGPFLMLPMILLGYVIAFACGWKARR